MAYTSIDDPSAYFQVALWTGGNDASRTITNDGNSDLQPDWIWAKARTSTPYTDNHFSVDSSRGRLKGLVQNDTSVETTTTGNATQQAERDLVSFNTDGFTVGIVNSTAALNASSASHVAWQWKANGGTTSSNTDGSITSTVQANTDAGFSIVTWTSNGSAGQTIGHGLGVAPDMVILKNRSATEAWQVYHQGIGAGKHLMLNSSNAEAANTNIWSNTSPTSTLFYAGTNTFSSNNDDIVMYCFAEKQGYSKFGKYIGNGSSNGTFVYTGFKPRWIMQKNASTAATSWFIYDSKRDTGNPLSARIAANATDAETSATYSPFDFYSNGFKLRDGTDIWNESGSTHIYMAFAENPFVTSTGIPTTAR